MAEVEAEPVGLGSSPGLLASPGGPVHGSELCLCVPQAGRAKPRLRTGKGLPRNPLSGRRCCRGRGQEALRPSRAPPAVRADAFQSGNRHLAGPEEGQGAGSGLVSLQLLSSAVTAVDLGGAPGVFPGSGWVLSTRVFRALSPPTLLNPASPPLSSRSKWGRGPWVGSGSPGTTGHGVPGTPVPSHHLPGSSLLAGNLLLPGRDQVVEGDSGDAGSDGLDPLVPLLSTGG